MTATSFSFKQRSPVRWTGRYARIPGNSSVLHVRWDGTTQLIWQDAGILCTCEARATPPLERMAQAINRVKLQRTGQPGGSFIINEFGQVLCPVADESFERFYVGDCRGAITFVDPDGNDFTLDDDAGLQPGDDWKLPYLGMPFNLSGRNRIYFQQKNGVESECIYAPVNDQSLIHSLRAVRPYGGVRFIVNPHGIVLTKVNEGHADWNPKYVGRINLAHWFAKELV